MSGGNLIGKILGHILLVIASSVLGVAVGFYVGVALGRLGHAWHLEWLTHPVVSIVCAVVGGLVFLFFGARTSRAFEKHKMSWHDK